MQKEYIKTNHGLLSLEDYLDIRAMQNGFDDYEDMRNSGICIEKPETVTMDS